MPLPDDRFVFTPPEGSREVTVGAPAGTKPTEQASPAGTKPTERASPAVLLPEVKPEYSPEARAAGLQGTVSLYVELNKDGHPGHGASDAGVGARPG